MEIVEGSEDGKNSTRISYKQEKQLSLVQTLLSMGFENDRVHRAVESTLSMEEALENLLHNYDHPEMIQNDRRRHSEIIPETFVPSSSSNDSPRSSNINISLASNESTTVDLITSEQTNHSSNNHEEPLNEENRNLKQALERRDSLKNQIEKQRSMVRSFANQPYYVGKETLEELYLFLKEMIHTNVDLRRRKDEIHEFVFSRIRHSHSSLIPCLIELLVLENEDFQLIRLVHSILDTDRDCGFNEDTNLEKEGNKQADVPFTKQLVEMSESHTNELDEMQDILNQLRINNSGAPGQKANSENRKETNGQQSPRSHNNDKSKKSIDQTNEDDRARDEGDDREKDERRNRAILSGMKKAQNAILEEIENNTEEGSARSREQGMNRTIATALIDAHLTETNNLQASMELERKRQQDLLQQRLLERKRRGSRQQQKIATVPLNKASFINTNNDSHFEPDGLEEFGQEKRMIDSELEHSFAASIQQPTEWLAGNLVGVHFVASSHNNMKGDSKGRKSFSKSMTGIITTFQSLFVENMTKLQIDLWNQRITQEKLFRKDFVGVGMKDHDHNVGNGKVDYSQRGDFKLVDEALKYFSDKFCGVQKTLLRASFSKFQEELKDFERLGVSIARTCNCYSAMIDFLSQIYGDIKQNKNNAASAEHICQQEKEIKQSALMKCADKRIDAVYNNVLSPSTISVNTDDCNARQLEIANNVVNAEVDDGNKKRRFFLSDKKWAYKRSEEDEEPPTPPRSKDDHEEQRDCENGRCTLDRARFEKHGRGDNHISTTLLEHQRLESFVAGRGGQERRSGGDADDDDDDQKQSEDDQTHVETKSGREPPNQHQRRSDEGVDRNKSSRSIPRQRKQRDDDQRVRAREDDDEATLDDEDEVKKIVHQHAKERETLEITLELERARQKQKLQERLAFKKKKRQTL